MGKTRATVAGLVVILGMTAIRADDSPSLPADFKVQVGSYSLSKEVVFTEDILIRQGLAYVFPSNSKEIIIVDPGRSQVDLVDVGRKLQTEVSFRSLDDALVKIGSTLRGAAERLEKQGGRANEVEAKMTRDLFETKLEIAEDPKSHRVRLTNPAVEVAAIGEPEADPARLTMIATTLRAIAKLGAFRAPNDLPPFVELEAIAALTGDRRLRPTELSYLYRLAGPPRKLRRTYQLIPTLTEREVEAVARVNRFRETAPNVRYERYRLAR